MDVPRQTLRDLIARYGVGLCSDARRCEGLLRDLCGAHRREINILVSALEERIPLDLLAARSTTPRVLLRARLAKRLEDQLALTEDAARWAVDSWALALGVVTDAEVAEGERKTVGTATPPPAPVAAPPDAEDEDDAKKEGREAQPHTTRPAVAPRQPPQRRPPAQASPPVSRPTNLTPPAPAARPTIAVRQPSVASHTNAPSPSATTSLHPPAQVDNPAARGGRRKWRGCLVGCFLLALLSLALFIGVPFVVSVLREEQQRRNDEPPPALSP